MNDLLFRPSFEIATKLADTYVKIDGEAIGHASFARAREDYRELDAYSASHYIKMAHAAVEAYDNLAFFAHAQIDAAAFAVSWTRAQTKAAWIAYDKAKQRAEASNGYGSQKGLITAKAVVDAAVAAADRAEAARVANHPLSIADTNARAERAAAADRADARVARAKLRAGKVEADAVVGFGSYPDAARARARAAEARTDAIAAHAERNAVYEDMSLSW